MDQLDTRRGARLDLTMDDRSLVLQATGVAQHRGVDESAVIDRVEAAGGRISGGRDPDGRLNVRVDFPPSPAVARLG
jgi:hypothetical protein